FGGLLIFFFSDGAGGVAPAARAGGAAAPAADPGTRGRDGDQEYSLRYILTHMIEEYARHNGHADLLREAIDGATGE
ncbi:DUF664 domain-containing protein, partial [Streptomyces sp. NPDC058662]|uniref:mycothiol transferase n=1 Tax=Streptomyces sp. NPDC058662 TaxID=3346583 RepID=UPI00365DB94C